jgi:hypothetical protein
LHFEISAVSSDEQRERWMREKLIQLSTPSPHEAELVESKARSHFRARQQTA